MHPLSVFLILTLTVVAAQKPSPFVPRKSEPAVAPSAPVAPVSPVRMKSGVMRPMAVLPSVVAPVVRPQTVVAVDATPPEPIQGPAVASTSAVPAVAPIAAIVPPAPLPVAVVVMEAPRVSSIELGASREEMIAKVGKPSATVSMYDDATLVESMRYEWKGRWLGTIQVSNGKVTKIDTPR